LAAGSDVEGDVAEWSLSEAGVEVAVLPSGGSDPGGEVAALLSGGSDPGGEVPALSSMELWGPHI
jgi:hypothetical protein